LIHEHGIGENARGVHHDPKRAVGLADAVEKGSHVVLVGRVAALEHDTHARCLLLEGAEALLEALSCILDGARTRCQHDAGYTGPSEGLSGDEAEAAEPARDEGYPITSNTKRRVIIDRVTTNL
jgi:hypothetical protein